MHDTEHGLRRPAPARGREEGEGHLTGSGVGGYKAYVFDLDGTLVTLPVDWKSVREEAESLGYPPPQREPFFEWLEGEVASRKEAAAVLFPMIDRHELASAGRSALQPGAFSLLQLLSSKAKLALVTMQGAAACRELLSTHGISGLFTTVLTREDSLSREDQIRSALVSLGAVPSESLVVGDRANDVSSAQRTGSDAALIGGRGSEGAVPTYSFVTLNDFAAAVA